MILIEPSVRKKIVKMKPSISKAAF
jgi:hypothetical protein